MKSEGETKVFLDEQNSEGICYHYNCPARNGQWIPAGWNERTLDNNLKPHDKANISIGYVYGQLLKTSFIQTINLKCTLYLLHNLRN